MANEVKDVNTSPASGAVDVGTAADVDEMMKKFDRESNTRHWTGTPKKIIRYLLSAFTVFMVYMNMFAVWDERIRRCLFMGFIFILVFLMYPAKKGDSRENHIPWYDWILMIVGAAITAIFGISLVTMLGEVIAYGWYSYMMEDLFPMCGFFAGGVAMLVAGQRMKRRSARVARYLAVMGKRSHIAVDELCAVTGKSRKKVESDLDFMVEKGLLGAGAYLDSGRGMFFRNANAFADYANETAKKANVTPKEANEGYAGALRAIRSANDRIADPVLSEKIDHLETVAGKIFREVEQHPEKQQQAATFLNYYLPTTLKLLDSYAKFEEAGIEGENLSRAQERIEETMDALIKGFDKQLDDLYRSEAMDIDSDIRVMENMLRRDTASVEEDFGLGGAAAQRAPDEE